MGVSAYQKYIRGERWLIPDHLLDSKRLILMPRTVWIFDLENMVDSAGIGKEVILLKQPALFVVLDYFQLSSYRLWVCWRPTCS